LKNVKNEIRYMNVNLSSRNKNEYKARLVSLFNVKKELVREILILKSAFSVIDQMFHLEISNAEISKSRWGLEYFWKFKQLKNPLELNPFVKNLMDPFEVRL